MQIANKPETKHLQSSYYNSRAPISNVEIKNIGSAGKACFTQWKVAKRIIQSLFFLNSKTSFQNQIIAFRNAID